MKCKQDPGKIVTQQLKEYNLCRFLEIMRKKQSDVEKLLEFFKLTHTFQQIQRMVRATGEHRWETDSEHTFQLVLVAWYLINSMKLNLDLFKVILYCIVHDFPEVHAGDPCVFTDGARAMKGKSEREKKARKKLARDFPEFPQFHEMLEAYEHRKDKEAIFVWALDKLVPFYNIYLDGGLTWRQFNTTFEMLLAEKEYKINQCPVNKKIFAGMLVLLRNRQGELFSPFVPFPEKDRVPVPLSRLQVRTVAP